MSFCDQFVLLFADIYEYPVPSIFPAPICMPEANANIVGHIQVSKSSWSKKALNQGFSAEHSVR